MRVLTYSIRPVRVTHKLIRHLFVRPFTCLPVRTQSLKNSNIQIPLHVIDEANPQNDKRLKEIIETSNFGSEVAKKKQIHDKKLQEQEAFEKLAKNKEKEDQQDQTHKSIGEEKTEDTKKKDMFNIDYATSNEINENIQKEIGNLPSQKETKRYQISKKLEEYLDSLQDTIFTASQKLNDVTGYSSIEKLKESIQELESQLKQEKDTVKKCKDLYSKAILRRSLLQREINELLTRKHDWSPEDLERFTNLYRNDHVNEQEELNTHNDLNAAEQRVDAIQLKLTQLILTRYHEEQIWSDKIRRASTWGTWILMGINLFLFVLATFLVEPWKRKRLVGSFEDKVKQAIVEMSELQNGKWDQILSQQNNASVQPIEPVSAVSSWFFNTDDSENSSSSSVYPISFSLVERTWNGLKRTVSSHYYALRSTQIRTLQFEKYEFGWFATTITLFGCALGSLITMYFT